MIELVLVEFDELENDIHKAVCKTVIANFIDGGSLGAREKCNDFLSGYNLDKFCIGWDRKIYPYFELNYVDDPI